MRMWIGKQRHNVATDTEALTTFPRSSFCEIGLHQRAKLGGHARALLEP